jgi:hypothetical protein
MIKKCMVSTAHHGRPLLAHHLEQETMVRITREEVCDMVIQYVEKQHEGSAKALNFVDAVSGGARSPKRKMSEVLLIAKRRWIGVMYVDLS